jgi:hypothetical protein
MNSRIQALLSVLLIAIFFAVVIGFNGFNGMLRMWHIPYLVPRFADLAALTHGAEAVRQGLDPLLQNPADPWGRPLNYPRVWQWLYLLGLNPSHTFGLGIAMIVAYLGAVVLILPGANLGTLASVMVAVASPASLLAMERANIDLIVFVVLAVSVVLARRSLWWPLGGVLGAFVMKIYPVFALVYLARYRGRVARSVVLVAMVFVAVYLVLMLPELRLVLAATPQANYMSYGANVFLTRYAERAQFLAPFLSVFVRLAAMVIAGCLVGMASLAPGRVRQEVLDGGKGRQEGGLSMDCFRVGSAIYMGTFLLSNNWDYRLIFLIFVIPQLVAWVAAGRARVLRFCSFFALFLIFYSQWSLMISGWISMLPGGDRWAFGLDELANWLLFFQLTYLFFLSLPPSLIPPALLARRA